MSEAVTAIRRVLVVGDPMPAEIERLARLFPDVAFTAVAPDDHLSALAERVAPDAVYSINGPSFPPETHRRAIAQRSVRWVHVGGSGYEHVSPVPPGRVLTNSPGLLAETHAVTVIGMIVTLNGRLTTYLDQQVRRLWLPHVHRPIRGQTLLVVGLGRVGAATARMARLLGMRVIGVKRRAAPHPEADEVVAFDHLHEALAAAEVVSVHLRAEPATRHAFDRAAFAAMRKGAIFLNTARGSVVDEAALAQALKTGHLAAAHLDVTETEPLPPDSPLWDLPNLVITPHVADAVETWPRLFADAFAENLRRWNAGEALLNRVESDFSRAQAGA